MIINKKVELISGEMLEVKVVEPPLTKYLKKSQEGHLLDWVWSEIKNEIQNGQMTKWLYMPYALGIVGNRLVASMAYFTPRETRDIGVIEFVETLSEYRRKNISTILLSTLVEHFESQGGVALSLCTTNPIAGKLYENLGFWYSVGDGMTRISNSSSKDLESFNDLYFQNTGQALVREATWSDLPKVSFLYNSPNPKWILKDYLSESFSDTRYESHFVKTFLEIQKSFGKFLLLESNEKKIVGSVVIQRKNNFLQQHCGIISFRVVPSYFEQTIQMLEAAKIEAAKIGISVLECFVAKSDREQVEFLESSGFNLAACLEKRLYDGTNYEDVLILSFETQKFSKNRNHQSDYYGARQNWQIDRINNSC